ncbi:MAG: endo-1,4-beta-xylanase [Beijerinckiaceae bacterium]
MMQMTRRQMVGALAVGAGLPGASAAQTRQHDAASFPLPGVHPVSLGAMAQQRGILFGASVATSMLTHSDYKNLYKREARILTTDYEMKFGALRPDSVVANFDAADRLIAFAQEHQMAMRGHALIWNENMPAWAKALSRREVEGLFDRHIEEVVTRYAGKMHSWDVINEPFWPDHGMRHGYRRGLWYDTLGPSYIRYAFQRAARFDRSAKLTLNEAFCERNDALGQKVRAALLMLIDDLRDNDTPVHAVGLQAHLQPQFAYDDDAFVDFLQKIAKRGLDIYITELDVDDSSFGSDVRERDERVAQRYEAFLTKVLTVPQVKIIVLWQLGDRFSWYRDPEVIKLLKSGPGARPLPFDEALKPKPAYAAIARALKSRAVV